MTGPTRHVQTRTSDSDGASVNGTMLGAWVSDLLNGQYDTVGP